MSATWRLAPAPSEDELLSSFLVRVAHAHGTGAYRFFSYHLSKIPIWNRDIDRNVSNSTLERIALMSGLSFDHVNDMTLRSYALRPWSRQTLLENAASCAISPWINAIGIYHTTRRRFGLQYCPECLVVDPAYKKHWRLSLVTVCPLHHCALLDACPSCNMPVVPHRNHVSHLNCHVCQRSLTKFISPKLEPLLIEKLFTLQNLHIDAHGHPFSIEAETSEVFTGVHSLLSIFRTHRRHCYNRYLLANAGEGPIELLGRDDRTKVMIFLYRLLFEWPNSFREIATETGLNQLHAERKYLPPWVHSEISLLPSGNPKGQEAKRISLTAELRSTQREKPNGWRARRADLLLKMAKRKP